MSEKDIAAKAMKGNAVAGDAVAGTSVTRNRKAALAALFALLFAATALLMLPAEAAWAADDAAAADKAALSNAAAAEDADEGAAEDADGEAAPDKAAFMRAASAGGESSDGTRVHADPATFEKNYCLTPGQKEYAITKIDSIVSRLIKPEMSDLEKYYTLAVWENKHVKYDGKFWTGGYNFDLYRHQWDAYGVLTEKSVCVGIAITFANLCHAADLPCKFVRTDPEIVDHTINYIPDINGNAYYVDVTENSFLMSEEADVSFEPHVDKEFAHITKPCTDGTFEYHETFSDLYFDDDEPVVAVMPSNLKKCYKLKYEDWFKIYALHEKTESPDEGEEANVKEFLTPYVERGSGLRAGQPGAFHASYHSYPSQFSDAEPPVYDWFLEDFYKDPETVRAKILNKELDEQLLDISGVGDLYDCDNPDSLAFEAEDDILIRYFPSSQDGEVVPWADDLKTNVDYTLSCTNFDKAKGKATIAVQGTGDYTGSYEISVRIKKSNPMTLSGRTATVSYSRLSKKAQTIKRAKAIKVSKAKGKVSYKLVSATKGGKSFKKKFRIDKKTGKITVKKGLKKGTYKLRVKVKAAGDADHDASAWKTVTVKVRVK